MPPSWPDLQTTDYTTGTQLIMPGALLEGLVGYNKDFSKIVPKVANSWTHNKNYTVWTFNLRHDAKWSNGQPVTANDFYFSWMWLARPGQKGFPPMYASPMQFIVNGYAYESGSVPASKVGLKVLNKWTLQCTLANPNPNFLEGLVGGQNGGQSLPLYPPLIKKHPTDWYLPKYFVGNGPYLLSSFKANGQMVLTRNPKYVGHPGEYNVGNLKTITIIPSSSTPLQAYMSNTTDVALLTNPSDYIYAKTKLKDQYVRSYSTGEAELTWDHSVYASPYDKLDVRKAIAYAIDRTVIANKVDNGMSLPVGTLMPKKYDAYETFSLPLTAQVKQAQKLLAQAGYPGGKGLPTLYFYQASGAADPVLESVQAQLKANLGIQSKIVELPSQIAGSGTYDFANLKEQPGFVDGSWEAPGPGSYSVEFGVQFVLPQPDRAHFGKALSMMNAGQNNPYAVKAYGNPSNKQLGLKWSDWAPMVQDFNTVNAWMQKYGNTPGLLMQNPLPGSPTNQQLWDSYVAKWKAAKTDADKHAAWLTAWQYLGGNGGNYGLDLSLEINKDLMKEPSLLKLNAENTKLGQISTSQAQKLGGAVADEWEQLYWEIPLTQKSQIALQKPGLMNVPYNPYTWDNIINLQYMSTQAK
jgi:peptide/nickel transport system substrate-binding protein/oligopeptide transport system substrate-binding protein